MESSDSVQVPQGSLLSRYLKLTENEEKEVSVITPEMKHAHNIWLVKLREDQIKTAANKGLEGLDDLYSAKYTLKRLGDDGIIKLNHTIMNIGIRVLVETVARHIPDKMAKMIDIGAGSGNFGVKLKEAGFAKIDALEPGEKLVNVIPKGVYEKIYNEFISADKPTSIPSDIYDVVLSRGAVFPEHIEPEHFPELIRILKPGGCIIFNIADTLVHYKNFGANLDMMLQLHLEDGTLESVLKERAVFFYDVEDSNIYILKKSSNK